MQSDPQNSKHSFFPSVKKEENEEYRWQVSYLDIVTLLLAFLIIILAITQTDLLSTVTDRFESDGDTELIMTPIGEIKENLEDQLEQEIQEERLSIDRELNDLRITFSSTKLYRSGEAQLIDQAQPLLNRVLEALQNSFTYDFNIDVEGHTDNAPIIESPYPSNWELSTARAANVVRYFAEQGISQDRLKASGYGYSRPKVPNEDSLGNPLPENMEQNRRVVLRIYQDADQFTRRDNGTDDHREIAGTNSAENSCDYYIEIGRFETLRSAIRNARSAEDYSEFAYRLAYRDSKFAVRASTPFSLTDAVVNYSNLATNENITPTYTVRFCNQDPKWLQYFVQLASFSNPENATNFTSQVNNRYDLQSTVGAIGNRVLVGPFDDYETALQNVEDIRQIDSLADAFLIYDESSVDSLPEEYKLRIGSDYTAEEAESMAQILTNELNIPADVHQTENNSAFVFTELVGDFETILEWQTILQDYGKTETVTYRIKNN